MTQKPVPEHNEVLHELLALQERLALAVESATIGTWDWNPQSDVAVFDSGWITMLGYKPDEIEHTSKWWMSLMHPEEVVSTMRKVRDHFDGKTPEYRAEYRMQHRDGSWVEVLAVGRVFERDEQNLPVRMVGVHIDISARRNAENALRARDQQTSQLFQNVPGMIYQYRERVDGSCHVPFTTPGISEIFGCSPDDVREDSAHLFDRIHTEDVERVKGSVALSKEGLTPWRCEFRSQHPQHGEIWVEGYATPFREEDGSTLWHGYICDITERKRIEIEAANARLQLETFVEHAPAAVAMFDNEMRYLAYSKRWITDYKLKSEVFVGRSHYDVFPEITDEWKEIHERCLEGKVERCPADPFVRLSGETQWLEWEVRPWFREDGSVG
ncbi:MAG: PAS domain-containing protein, partial [Bdellovibrionales bacterium]|nr:PAS domain-containing protein [Bdellovibrionales bacterium]